MHYTDKDLEIIGRRFVKLIDLCNSGQITVSEFKSECVQLGADYSE